MSAWAAVMRPSNANKVKDKLRYAIPQSIFAFRETSFQLQIVSRSLSSEKRQNQVFKRRFYMTVQGMTQQLQSSPQ
jgi:hypothetical protein